MLARLYAVMPFRLIIPEGAEFKARIYEDSGYKVCILPPRRSERPLPPDSADEVTIDSGKAYLADVLHINFWKDSFNREPNTFDPPGELIQKIINSFLSRLRHVTRASHIQPIDFPYIGLNLRYLNDDETELEEQEGLVRGHRAQAYHFGGAVVLDPQVWNSIHALPGNFEPTPWSSILIDASAEMPSYGPAIVLSSTALEVFIAFVLNKLVEKTQAIPASLWDWINSREEWKRQPTVEEEFDSLLKFLSGHSLKEDARLWAAFKNLKAARNSFVHGGVAKVGGQPVSAEMARKLIGAATEIISKIRTWIPEDIQWPEYAFKFDVQFIKNFTSPAKPGVTGKG